MRFILLSQSTFMKFSSKHNNIQRTSVFSPVKYVTILVHSSQLIILLMTCLLPYINMYEMGHFSGNLLSRHLSPSRMCFFSPWITDADVTMSNNRNITYRKWCKFFLIHVACFFSLVKRKKDFFCFSMWNRKTL